MFEPLDLLLPTGVSFEQRLAVFHTLRSACRVDTPEIARTQDCSRDATQQPLSPICYYYQGEDDEEEVLSPAPDVALSTFPPDEDITSAFASISIGLLDGEISDVEEEEEEEQAPFTTTCSRSRRGTKGSSSRNRSSSSSGSSRSSGVVSKHGSYGALVLQKKPSKAPLEAAPAPVAEADKRLHAGTQQWLKAAYLSLGFCTLVVSPQTRTRVVCTVAQDIASRLLHEGLAQQTPMLALRNSPDAGRGALVVTSSKAAAEEWYQEFRAHAHVRLLAYVDSIAQRRALGSHRLRGHDVVVTTFDVLKAIEVGLPQEGEQAREEGEDDWLRRRPPPVGPVVQGSLLHLLRFREVVLDFHELASSVKMTNKRGAAARLVAAELRCSLVPAAEMSEVGDVYLSAAVRNAREVMGCPGAIIASSITLDAHL